MLFGSCPANHAIVCILHGRLYNFRLLVYGGMLRSSVAMLFLRHPSRKKKVKGIRNALLDVSEKDSQAVILLKVQQRPQHAIKDQCLGSRLFSNCGGINAL